MSESDDEIYKKAYADEQERIRIEAIKEKAQEDAQLAALGLSPRQKKTRLGRWVQKQKLLMDGGDPHLAHLNRHELQKRIDDLKKRRWEVTKIIIDKKRRLEKENQSDDRIHFQRSYHPVTGAPLSLHVDENFIPPGTERERSYIRKEIELTEKELKLRERLNTY